MAGTYTRRVFVMRYAARPGWRGKYPTIVTVHRSVAAALADARGLRRYSAIGPLWLAAVGAPATLPRRQQRCR